MKYFNQIIGILKKLGITIHPALLAVLMLVVPLAIAAGVYLYKRWQQKRAAAPAQAAKAPDVPERPGARALPKRALRAAWKEFLSALPGSYRRSILGFQPFVVLAGPTARARELIDAYTDWQRQDKQFLRSQPEHEHLRVYLGSTTLVQELSPAIVDDVSIEAREALNKLWQPLFRRREPIAVVPVSCGALERATPDEIKKQSEILRGKINVLSWAPNRPIVVRVALTELEALPGFAEFTAFARRHGVPLALDLPAPGTPFDREALLRDELRKLHAYLPLALTTLPAHEYALVLQFLRRLPECFGPLAEFLAALYEPEPLSKTPIAGKLYLVAEGDGRGLSNPFENPLTPSDLKPPSPLRPHQYAAAAVAAAGALYLIAGYAHESGQWGRADRALRAYESRSDANADRGPIMAFLNRDETDPLAMLFPSFFGAADADMAARLAQQIRKDQFLPRITEPHDPRELVYHLALYHLCEENQPFHRTFKPEAYLIGAAVGVPKELIADYLEVSKRCPDKAVFDAPAAVTLANAENDTHAWIRFFLDLKTATDRATIDLEELETLRKRASELHRAGSLIDTYQLTAKLTADGTYLQTTYGDKLRGVMKDLSSPSRFGRRPDILAALDIVAKTDVAPKPTALIDPLCDQLRVTLESSAPSTQERHQFVLREEDAQPAPPGQAAAPAGTTAVHASAAPGARAEQPAASESTVTRDGDLFTFYPKRWYDKVRNTRGREQVLSFVRAALGRSIFFETLPAAQASVPAGPTSDKARYFSVGAGLDPRYTLAGYSRYVRPGLECFAELFPRIGLESDDRTLVHEFVLRQSEQYALNYARAIREYYGAFDVHAESQDDLQAILSYLRAPLSPLVDMLRITHRNTQLGIATGPDANPYLAPIARELAPFAPLGAVLGIAAKPAEGAQAEEAPPATLPFYFKILEELEGRLRGAELAASDEGAAQGGAAPDGAAPGQPELLGRIDTAGKLALNILRGLTGQRVEGADYRLMVAKWANESKLDDFLARPFYAPIEQLYRVGKTGIEHEVLDAWKGEVRAAVQPVLKKFPFDRKSTQDVTAEEMHALFHPTEGAFWTLIAAYLEPISDVSRWQLLRPKRGAFAWNRDLAVPDDIYQTIHWIGALSQTLWDAKGNPRPQRVEVQGVPFAPAQFGEWAVTLTYLTSGDTHFYNFNQVPQRKALLVDWTKPHSAGVGVQLTSRETGRPRHPEPLRTPLSHWALLRLINLSTVQETKSGAGASAGASPLVAREWLVPHDGKHTTHVSFLVQGDPFAVFDLPQAVWDAAVAGAPAGAKHAVLDGEPAALRIARAGEVAP